MSKSIKKKPDHCSDKMSAGTIKPAELPFGYDGSKPLSHDESDRLIQELQVHQLELELQNEELRQAQIELEKSRHHFRELYDQSPVGFATLSRPGLVLQINATLQEMLGRDINEILGRPLAEFIVEEDRNVFISRYRAFFNRPSNKFIDVSMQQQSGGQFSARFQGRGINGNEWGVPDNLYPEDKQLLVIISDVTELKKSEARIHFQAFHDALTQLPNRMYLLEQLRNALSHAQRHQQFGALLFLDLDRFKIINDSLGHNVGDRVLEKVSERMRTMLRKEDIIARMGGDEFVVIVDEYDNDPKQVAVSANRIAHKIITCLATPFEIANQILHIGTSIGISVFPSLSCQTPDDIIRNADTAMYQAKSHGRGQVCFFEPTMQDEAEQRLRLEADLRAALLANAFFLVFQPVYKRKGQIASAEALLRFKHPSKGVIEPEAFIAVAEETGLIVEIGRWVIKEALDRIKEMREKELCTDFMGIAVNISRRQLADSTFADFVEAQLIKRKEDGSCLIFEITESVLESKEACEREQLLRIKKMGIRLSVDDFGTGYSSLSVLRHGPVSELKIDRQFVESMDKDGDDAVIVETIIQMAHNMSLSVIAEGVETPAIENELCRLGVDRMQGFLFSKPLNFRDFCDALFLQKNNQ